VLLALGNRVLIVEPNANCRRTLDFLFSKNPSVLGIIPKAIGSREGQIEFYAHGTDSTASAKADWDKNVFGSDRGQAVQSVSMVTLDSLIRQYGKPDFVKIDVEGFETEVLTGLSCPLPLISFEFHSDNEADTIACLDLLRKHSAISIRACSMDCEWLTQKTTDIGPTIAKLSSLGAKGGLFVWSDADYVSSAN
jgi:FkbM family methyltransferase